MELDNLKEIWKEHGGTGISKSDKESLTAILNRKSGGPVDRMKRNLISELVAVILLYGFVFVFFLTAFQGQWRMVGWIYFILGFLYLVYFYRKYQLLSGMECLSCQVKSNLQRRVRTLEKYVRFYLLSGTLAIFLLLWFFWILFLVNAPALVDRSLFFPGNNRSLASAILYWFIFTLFATLLMHQLNKWWVNRLYGRHIRKLQDLLNQMEEVEN